MLHRELRQADTGQRVLLWVHPGLVSRVMLAFPLWVLQPSLVDLLHRLWAEWVQPVTMLKSPVGMEPPQSVGTAHSSPIACFLGCWEGMEAWLGPHSPSSMPSACPVSPGSPSTSLVSLWSLSTHTVSSGSPSTHPAPTYGVASGHLIPDACASHHWPCTLLTFGATNWETRFTTHFGSDPARAQSPIT